MTENQQPYEIKVGQHGKNCECSKCQSVKTTFCECETCQSHSPDKQESTKDRLKRFLAEAKDQDGELRCEDGSVYRGKAYEPEVSGESVKDYNRDEEGMPCDFCSHHVRAETSYCVTCDPENSNYDGAELEVEAEDNVKYDPKSRYYDAGGLEVLDIIRAKLTPEQYQGFCLGNAIKYTCRANHKGDFDRDMEKACFYSKEAANEHRGA